MSYNTTIKSERYNEIKNKVESCGYIFIDAYQRARMRIIIQDDFGYKYDVEYRSLDRNKRNYFADAGNPFTIENINLFLQKDNREYSLCEDNIYINNSTNMKWFCFNCENYFDSIWDLVYSGNRKCGICTEHQVIRETSFAYLFPKYAKEMIYSENNIDLYKTPKFSNERVCWKCSDCGHEWDTLISTRRQCPVCCGRIVSDKNRLSIIRPDIASEWHPIKNEGLTANDFSYASEKSAWWLCQFCGSSWEGKISERTRKDIFRSAKCNKCSASLGELKIYKLLESQNIDFKKEAWFEDCPRYGSHPLRFDFYLPDYKVCIEFHGPQHYCPIDFAGRGMEWAKDSLKNIQARDEIKENYCHQKEIAILIIPFWDYNEIETILINELELY